MLYTLCLVAYESGNKRQIEGSSRQNRGLLQAYIPFPVWIEDHEHFMTAKFEYRLRELLRL